MINAKIYAKIVSPKVYWTFSDTKNIRYNNVYSAMVFINFNIVFKHLWQVLLQYIYLLLKILYYEIINWNNISGIAHKYVLINHSSRW